MVSPTVQLVLAGVLYALMWFSASIGLTFLNKWFFGTFPFPLFTSATNMLIKSIIARLLLCGQGAALPNRSYFWRVSSIGVATGLDVGLSNQAIGMVSIVVYTLVKASASMWVLLFSLLFKLRRFTVNVLVIIVIMCVGVGLAVYKPRVENQGAEHRVYVIGVVAVVLSTVLAGFRWAFTQIVLGPRHPPPVEMIHSSSDSDANFGAISSRETQRIAPLVMVVWMGPAAAASIFVFAVAIESSAIIAHIAALKPPKLALVCGVFILGGAMAVMLIWSELRLVNLTSGLSLAVLGIIKELLTIVLSILILGESLSLINAAGMVVCLLGIVFYNYDTHREHVLLMSEKTVVDFSLETMEPQGGVNAPTDEPLFQSMEADDVEGLLEMEVDEEDLFQSMDATEVEDGLLTSPT